MKLYLIHTSPLDLIHHAQNLKPETPRQRGMPLHTAESNRYSPKRKRDVLEPATPRLHTNLPVRQSPSDEIGTADDGSPRTLVAGRFQRFHLHAAVSKLDFEGRKGPRDSQRAGCRAIPEHSLLPEKGSAYSNPPTTPVSDEADKSQNDGTMPPCPRRGTANISQERLQPPSCIDRDDSPNPANRAQHSGPRKARSPSPPPPESLTWHDSEITGHQPDDPHDDGYGINGIGFRPTPAIAYARSQKRAQQILEWKNREAREARQKRSERRRAGSRAPMEATEGTTSHQRRKVTFSEG